MSKNSRTREETAMFHQARELLGGSFSHSKCWQIVDRYRSWVVTSAAVDLEFGTWLASPDPTGEFAVHRVIRNHS